MTRTADAKSKIEEAALRLFVERGIAETSIREVAIAAGVSQGAMYNHYTSKDELAWDLFSRNFSEIGTELRRLAHAEHSIEQKLRAMIRYVFARFDKNWIVAAYVFLARHQFLNRISRKHGNPYTVFRLVIAEAVRRGEIPRQNVELATSMVTGTVIQVIDSRILNRIEGSLAGEADCVTDACVRLLGGKISRPRRDRKSA